MTGSTKETTRGFLDLWDFIHTRSGLAFAEGQLDFLRRRVQPRLTELHLPSYGDYLERVRQDPGEFDLLLDAVTVNDTAFWRESEQLRWFADELLPGLVDRLPRPVRLWCAGCATGEEAYTLGMLLMDRLGQACLDRVDFLASDISRRALAQAARGTYSAAAVEQLPQAWRAAYFTAQGESYLVSEALRALVRFEQGNLLDETWPECTGRRDVIFCRNVMIYFSQGVRREVASRFHAALSPGGYLILGTRESLHDVGRQFVHLYAGRSLVYRRAEAL